MTKGPWIQTYTGKQFFPLDPDPESIDIRDIAHALGMEPRYGGHAKWLYPVAQHCVLIARKLPRPLKLWGLIHDAPEAYGLRDICRPIKPHIPGYADLEDNLMRAVAARFGLRGPCPPLVKEYDTRILHDERAVLMGPAPADWGLPGGPLGVDIEEWSWQRAEREFLALFEELVG